MSVEEVQKPFSQKKSLDTSVLCNKHTILRLFLQILGNFFTALVMTRETSAADVLPFTFNDFNWRKVSKVGVFELLKLGLSVVVKDTGNHLLNFFQHNEISSKTIESDLNFLAHLVLLFPQVIQE